MPSRPPDHRAADSPRTRCLTAESRFATVCCRAVDQRRQVRFEMDASLLPPLRRQPGSAATICSGIRPGQLPALSGTTTGCAALVADDIAGEADQDRGQDRASRSIRDVPDGGGGHLSQIVSGDFAADRTIASGTTRTGDVSRRPTMPANAPSVTQSSGENCRSGHRAQREAASWKRS